MKKKDGQLATVFENAHKGTGDGMVSKTASTYLARLNVTLLKDLLEDVVLLCASTKLIL